MFRRYLQLAVGCGQKHAFLNQRVFEESGLSFVPKRGAGHAKWQNIKSTKEAADSNKSMNFQRIGRQIAIAVKKGGGDANVNPKLRSLLEEAQKANMPKSSVQKAIQSGTTSGQEPYWVVYTGPRGVILGLEVTFANKNPSNLNSKIASQTKKLNMKMETHFQDVCSEKGIIITKCVTDDGTSYDKALEHAIEVGAEDVFERDDKTLIFECLPERLNGVCTQLTKLGYEIDSATVELDFKEFVNLTEQEKKDIEAVVSKLQLHYDEVIRGTYNAAS